MSQSRKPRSLSEKDKVGNVSEVDDASSDCGKAGESGVSKTQKKPKGEKTVCRGGYSKVCGKELKQSDCVCCDVCHKCMLYVRTLA